MFVGGMKIKSKRICAMTTARNDTAFLEKWIAYYGQELGRENLLILLDGHDQTPPPSAEGLNIVQLPFRHANRAEADRRRAKLMSNFATGLFQHYDLVIATDVDEFLVADPQTGMGLRAYLSSCSIGRSISGLGLDVGQHPELEPCLDLDTPFLIQRRFAQVSARYTKSVVLGEPAVWGSGMHRVKGQNFVIDPNLYLFHFGMSDQALALGRATDPDRLNNGWGRHMNRRNRLKSRIVKTKKPGNDVQIASCRKQFTWLRAVFSWNKPMSLPNEPIIAVPDRFRGIV